MIDVSQEWPDLFVDVDETNRWAIVQAVASSQLEGYVPTREAVADLVDDALGRITGEEYVRRVRARAAAAVALAAAK